MANQTNGNTGLVKYGQSNKTFADYVTANKNALTQAASSLTDVKRLYRLVIACVSQTPALQQCTIASIFRAMQQAAELGLEPSSALGECYLVPYKDQAQLIVGYRGLIALARRSGEVETIQAFCVYEGDEFDVLLGLNPVLVHRPAFGTQDPTKIRFAYAIARLKGGISQFDVMTREEIDRIKARSRAGQSGPWVTDYAEMARKTVVRRLVKYLPMSIEMARAVEVDTQSEFGDLTVIDVPSESEPASPVEENITEGADLSTLAAEVPVEHTPAAQRH